MARELSRQFCAHSIAKTYLALVVHGDEPGLGNGAWTSPGAKTTGLITNPLRVDDDGRVRAGS
jgi:23S rRNA-/tRNA-specific pseudouridylate synthase